MNSVWILIGAIIFYAFGYWIYGRRLARRFGESEDRRTPAHTKYDGVDFVPAKNTLVLFGHHFSSICGAGPIVGPALACAYWGWAPSLVWILLGSVLMGAVSDYSSLFVSMRSDGKSISEIAKTEITPRARLFMSVFIWISIILVIAVFAIFAAKTFVSEPDAVVPSLGLIPVAVMVGWLMYARRMNSSFVTLIGLACLAALLAGGVKFPVRIGAVGNMTPEMIWIIVLLIYCGGASVAPVQVLLQPRDYLASFILFSSIGLGIFGILSSQPQMTSDVFHGFMSRTWPSSGPLWPMLFVTIACGAISGFHALVSSGTTCKQINSEVQACRVGYGGMLLEGFVGVMVIVCVSAGLSSHALGSVLKAGGPITAFSEGYGNITKRLLGDYGKPFAVMALNAFILTTLDTATRIARYLTSELFGIKNKHAATGVVVAAGGALALTGQWTKIWPAFGASNQLIAGLALLVASCWLMNRGRSMKYTFIPAIVMLVTTIAAFVYQLYTALRGFFDPSRTPDLFIAVIAAVLIAISIVISLDAFRMIDQRRMGGREVVEPDA